MGFPMKQKWKPSAFNGCADGRRECEAKLLDEKANHCRPFGRQ